MTRRYARYSALLTLLFFSSVIAVIVANTVWPNRWLSEIYPTTAGLILVAIISIGVVLNGSPAGLIIDNRNRMSLSKLQMLIWTIVVVSAITASAAYNIRNGLSDAPLEIAIPPELLFAMGIAATSFVAAPTVLSLKAQETPSAADVASASQAGLTAGGTSTLQNSGKVHGRSDPNLAQWSDLFRGDEVGNYDTPDLSKIQQFAVTLLLVGVYSSQIIASFSRLDPAKTVITTLPLLGSQFIVLMGVSHASYLVYKAAPHTASGDPQAAAPPPVAAPVDTAAP